MVSIKRQELMIFDDSYDTYLQNKYSMLLAQKSEKV